MELAPALTSACRIPAASSIAIARSTAYPLPMPPRSISRQSERKPMRSGATRSIARSRHIAAPARFRRQTDCRPSSAAFLHVFSTGAIVTSKAPPECAKTQATRQRPRTGSDRRRTAPPRPSRFSRDRLAVRLVIAHDARRGERSPSSRPRSHAPRLGATRDRRRCRTSCPCVALPADERRAIQFEG